MSAVDLASHVNTLCRLAFSPETIKNGLAYQQQHRVLHSNAMPHKNHVEIQARVRGSEVEPYLVEAKLYRKGGGISIESICTCSVGFNCKHAVAAIADVFDREGMQLFHVGQNRVELERPESAEEAPPEPLSYEHANWLGHLKPSKAVSATRKPVAPKVIVYVLHPERLGVRVEIMQVTRLKNGTLGKATASVAQNLGEDSPYEPGDLPLLRELAGTWTKSKSYLLQGKVGGDFLARLLATGKCHWEQVRHERPLKIGAARRGILEWKIAEDGYQLPGVRTEPESAAALPLVPAYYVDATNGECGLLETGMEAAFLQRWLAAPPLPPEQSRAVGPVAKSLELPAPQEIKVVQRRNVRCVPVLRLRHVVLKRPINHWTREQGYVEVSELDVGRLEFEYAGARVGFEEDEEFLETYQEGRVDRIVRDVTREAKAYNELQYMGMVHVEELFGYGVGQEIQDDLSMPDMVMWLAFMTDGVPELKKKGWVVEIEEGFHYQFAQVQEWYSETAADPAGNGNDWFSVELGILVDGQRHNLLPMIRGVLEQLEKYPPNQRKPDVLDLRLPDGRFVQLPAERVLAIGQVLAELYDPSSLVNDRLKVGRLRAAELVEIPGTGRWKGDEELRQLAQRIHAYKGIAPVVPPAGLNATLRPYQLEGLSWLQFLREYSFGGILADDMGLGKTVEVLAHLVMEKESGRANLPSLVVAPTSLMANWRAETEKFAPGLRVLVSHGGERKEHFERMADYDLIVTSYSLLPRDEEVLKKQPFHLLILDEAQYVKNPNTKWADVARSLSARHRLCMTGTPMENHLGELWSLMTFLSPGYLGSQQQFSRIYRTPIEKRNDQDRKRALAQRVRPFILRRRKEEVALDLPPKTEIPRTVELAGAQRDLYETIRLAMHERVRQEIAKKGMDRSHIIILDALLKLRQVCCDPRLVKLDRARQVKESAKLELLMDMVPEMLDEGRRILLFSQFTSMLDLIEPELKKRKIAFVRLTGETADRATPVRRFQAGEVPLFLISLKAGGTGLNLTAADSVIHYDPWWNPAVEQQATDRAHRIGQDKPVFVYKLVTKGTVEEKIVAMQERKRELVAGLLGDGSQQNLRLSKEELEHLFDPIG